MWGDKSSAALAGLGHCGIQERVPVTPFEDWIHGPKVAHHLHRARLPRGGINQWAVVVPWLQNRGVQLMVVLHPTGQDEATPNVFGVLFGILITELQGGTAYTTMQAHPHGTVVDVKMIRLDAFDVTGGIHQAIGRVRGDGHSATETVHKKTIGMPLDRVTPSLESIVHHLEVIFYVLDEIMDLAGTT